MKNQKNRCHAISLIGGLAALAATCTTAAAVPIGSVNINVAPGTAYGQRFNLYREARVTVTSSPALPVAIADASFCDAIAQSRPPSTAVIASSNSGGVTAALSAGGYCAVVQNLGSSAVNTHIDIDGEL